MDAEKKESGNKVLVSVLIFLCLMIVGLGVGITVTMLGKDGNEPDDVEINDGENVSILAQDFYDELVDKFKSNPNFVSSDAISECDKKLESVNNSNYYVNLVISCGGFLNEYGGGDITAASYMESKEEKINPKRVNAGLMGDYYSLLYRYFYSAGESKKAEHYLEKTNSILNEIKTDDNEEGA